MFMNINTFHDPSSKFISQSLAGLMNLPNLELIDLISKMTPLNPKQIVNLQDLAEKIKALPPIAEETKQNIEHLINNLIFEQFQNRELDSVREVVANAIDAKERAKSEDEPILITLEKDQLEVCDPGDGMSSGSLINYLVQGQTSNTSQYLIDPASHTAKVTGRFGQGGISIFYYLLYSSLPEPIELPEIRCENNKSIVTIPYFCNSKLYEVTFTYTSGDEDVKVESRLAPSPKKISIKTRSEKEALKIKFFEKDLKIYLNAYSLDPTLLSKGTRFKIVSPLIKKIAGKLTDSLEERFEFVSSTPIKLNGKLINNYKKISVQEPTSSITTPEIPEEKKETEEKASSSLTTKSDLQNFTLTKGSIDYSPLTAASNRNGKLSICEVGKTIMTFRLENSLVPEKIALNFNYLPLTQDRASINFEDPTTRDFITRSITEIFDSSLPSKEKSALLNSFYPLLKPDCFNMLPFMQKKIEKYEEMEFWPDLPEFEKLTLENTLLLNPEYLKNVIASKFHESGSFNFYKIKQSLSTPIIYSKFGGKTHFFIDSRLCDSPNTQHTYFNLTLMNCWLNLKEFGVQIPIKKKLGIKSSKKENLNITNKLHSPEEIIKYKDDSDANEEIDIRAVGSLSSHIENKFSKAIQAEAVEAVEKFFSNSVGKKVPKQYVRHLFHFMCMYDEARKFILDNYNDFYIPGYFIIPLEQVTSFLLNPLLYLAKHPNETLLYAVYFRNMTVQYYYQSKELLSSSDEPFHEVYCKWQKVIKASGCENFKLIKESLFSSMNIQQLDDLYHLINKLNEHKETVLAFWNELNDISYLVTLPSCKIDRIIKTIAYMHKKKYTKNYTKAHYEKISSLLDLLPEKLEKKSAWIYVYFELAYPINSWQNFVLNVDSLQPELLAIANESKDRDIVKQLIATVSRIRDFNKFENELNSKIKKIRTFSKNHVPFRKENLPFFLDILKNENILPATWPISWEEFIQGLSEYYPLQINLEAAPTRENLISARENQLERLEKSHCILPGARTLIYSTYIGGDVEFHTKGFAWPQLSSEILPLENDEDILAEFKNKELAATRIQNALDQTTREFAFILEIIKNCTESGASEIDIRGHLDTERHLVLEITDNGCGMGKKEIKALKLPGVTSKNKTLEDPNYGWGFYTALKACKKVFVDTSQDGKTETHLLFEKSKGLHIQTEEKNDKGFKGTKLLLKFDAEAPARKLLQMKAEIFTTCRYLKGVNITFQGKSLNQSNHTQAAVTHTETLIENGNLQRNIIVEIGNTNQGIYRKNIRIGDIPINYLELIPRKLKKILTQDGMSITIFLPDVKQNMNRNHLVNSSFLLHTIQRGVMAAAFQYIMPQLMKKDLNFISNDCWYDFRGENTLSPLSAKVIEAFKNNDWKILIDKEQQISQSQIFKKVEDFFLPFESQKINFPCGKDSVNDLTKAMKLELLEKELSIKNIELNNFFTNSRSLNEVLTNLPFERHKSSLEEVHKHLKKLLQKNGILNPKGEYCDTLLGLQQETYKKYLTDSLTELRKELNLGLDYDFLINKFESSILNKILAIKSQHSFTQESEDLPFLAKFIKTIAKECLNKEVHVVFYSKANGTMGCALQDSKTIKINRSSSEYKSLLDQFKNGGINFKELTNSMIKNVVKWLDLICHEMTHQEETSGSITHDKTFRELLCQKLEKLFITDENKKNCLQLFQESLQ
jgi:Histidine kinase-, DNA gyrase B-, and HSP90-like ATPase